MRIKVDCQVNAPLYNHELTKHREKQLEGVNF